MPRGKVHIDYWKKNWLITGAVTLAALVATKSTVLSAGIPVGYFFGRYVDQDSDQISLTYDDGRAVRELRIFGLILVVMLTAYAKFMRFVGLGRNGRRNFLSNAPGLATFIRYVWITWPLWLLYWLLAFYDTHLFDDFSYIRYFLAKSLPVIILFNLGFLAGLTISDIVHFIADWQYGRKRKHGDVL